ncbi:hypothetical protein AHAS_Ahas17G0088500 [Arachis hypogaea]
MEGMAVEGDCDDGKGLRQCFQKPPTKPVPSPLSLNSSRRPERAVVASGSSARPLSSIRFSSTSSRLALFSLAQALLFSLSELLTLRLCLIVPPSLAVCFVPASPSVSCLPRRR